jgi:hypothetical protein
MEITAIAAANDRVTYLAGATRVGEIYFNSPCDMVNQVVSRVYATSSVLGLERLNILSHGNSNSVGFGNVSITMVNKHLYKDCLQRLRGLFTSEGIAHFQACRIGNNLPLLRWFAHLWNVRVYAGTGTHNPVYRFNNGEYVVCDPRGICTPNATRP